MRTDRRVGRMFCLAGAMVAAALVATGPLWSDGGTDAHILNQAKDPWQLVSPVQVFSTEGLPEVDAHLGAIADGYEVVTCATARFGLADDGQVQATLLEMGSTLDALGVFAANRPELPQRVALASPAYWHEGMLRLFAGPHYLQLRPDDDGERGLALAQQLALQLEQGFPPMQGRPRIMRVMPRRYLNPYLLNWGLMEVCGTGQMHEALVGTRTIGDTPLTISVIECADAAAARDTWGQMLNVALAQAPTHEMPELGAEGFMGCDAGGLVCAAMWQDQFVAVATGDVSHADAEVVLRIVAMRIRTTRPLPHVALGD